MSKTRDTGFLGNVVKVDSTGNVFFVSGSTTLMSISSSGAVTTTGVISGSNALSSSYALNADQVDGLNSTSFVFTSSYNTDSSSVSTRVTRIEGNYATTGSNVFLGAQTVCANITSTGTIIAQTLNVQQVTSSVVYSSGSNIFGCLPSDVQQFTGSLRVTGSGEHWFQSGCVGIGTTTPCQKLHVFGQSDATKARFELLGVGGINEVLQVVNRANWSTSRGVKVGLYINSGSNQSQIGAEIGAVTNATDQFGGDLFFNVASASAATERMRITTAGNVGIGTITPTYHLEVRCAASVSCCYYAAMFARSTGANDGVGDLIAFGANGTTSIGGVYRTGASSWGIELQTSNGNTRMRIDNTGIATFCCQVCAPYISVGDGIQCNADDAPITIKRGVGFAGLDFKSLRTSGNIGGARFHDCNGTVQAQLLVEVDGSFNFYNATSNNRFKITSTGIACFACQVCVPRLQVFNTNSIIVVEGTATSGEGTVTIAGKNSSGTSRSAIFKYDNADIIRISTADAIPMRFETSDVTRLTIGNTGIATFTCQVSIGPTLTVGNQGGTDTTVIGGGSGVGSSVRMNFAGGAFNNFLAGNGDNFVNCVTGKLNAAGGVKFANGSGTLNYYEVGTWTPQLYWTNGGYYCMSGVNGGNYVRIGNVVHVNYQIQWSALCGSSGFSGQLRIGGLPFAVGSLRSAGTISAISSGIGRSNSCITYHANTVDPGANFVYWIENDPSGGYSHSPSVGASGLVYSNQVTYIV